MTQNTGQALWISGIAAVMVGGAAWLIPAAQEPGVWWFRIGGLIVLAVVIWIGFWAGRRPDLAPDFFATRNGSFFESDGFAFRVGSEVHDGICHLCVWFQNRYERACEATVLVCTAERWLAPQRHLPACKVSMSCLPGAYGKALAPWPLPMELQGRKVQLDVMASREYPGGQGKLVRLRTGLSVGSVPRSAVSDVLGVLGVFGGIHTGRAARAEIQLPQNVAEKPPPPFEERTETIWKLGDPIDMSTAA
ncbi:MAG TPA: hypothetical protein VK615_02260 [Candidatus Binatia bacterium]|nr:hypothetical protein [Candidatus Binatia bacterium]